MHTYIEPKNGEVWVWENNIKENIFISNLCTNLCTKVVYRPKKVLGVTLWMLCDYQSSLQLVTYIISVPSLMSKTSER